MQIAETATASLGFIPTRNLDKKDDRIENFVKLQIVRTSASSVFFKRAGCIVSKPSSSSDGASDKGLEELSLSTPAAADSDSGSSSSEIETVKPPPRPRAKKETKVGAATAKLSQWSYEQKA